MADNQTLTITGDAVPAVIAAVQAARDQLEAQAQVAQRSGTADERRIEWFRRRAATLGAFLEELGLDPEPARPDRAAVQEPDGTYTVSGGRVVRLVPKPDLSEVIDLAGETPAKQLRLSDVLGLLASATGNDPKDVLRFVADARKVARAERRSLVNVYHWLPRSYASRAHELDGNPMDLEERTRRPDPASEELNRQSREQEGQGHEL